jgi:hypothetical protein
MPADDVHAESARIMADGWPSYGYDLIGMQTDFYNYLEDLEEIDADSVSVERSRHAARDAARLIRASCRAAVGVSLDAAAAAVRDMWRSTLRYKYLEGHELRVGDDEAMLDFITQIGPHSLYVTGQVRILPSDG